MNKFMRWTGALSILFAMSCTDTKTEKKEIAADEKTETKNENNGFTIDAPEGWDKTDTSVMGKEVVFVRSPREGEEDAFMENVNVITEKTPNMELDEYYDKNVSGIANGLVSFERGVEGTRDVNGVNFKFLNYSHVYGDVPIDAKVFFAVRNGTSYVITCSAKGGEMYKWSPRFDEVVNSFRLK